jgi:C-terminal processing protease CtpA/Prc
MNNEFAYLKLQTFSPVVYKSIDASFEESLNRVFPLIVSANKKLIIDLRDNNGGSLGYASTLYSHLTDRNFRYFQKNEIKSKVANGQISFNQYCDEKLEAMPFEGTNLIEKDRLVIQRVDSTIHDDNPFLGPVYIVTNGLTFSSAAMFTSYCKMNRSNTFVVGEVPGGAASGCNGGGPITLNLPNSKLRLYFNLVQLDLNVAHEMNTIPMDLEFRELNNDDIYTLQGILDFVSKYNE